MVTNNKEIIWEKKFTLQKDLISIYDSSTPTRDCKCMKQIEFAIQIIDSANL